MHHPLKARPKGAKSAQTRIESSVLQKAKAAALRHGVRVVDVVSAGTEELADRLAITPCAAQLMPVSAVRKGGAR